MSKSTTIIVAIVAIALVGAGVFFVMNNDSKSPASTPENEGSEPTGNVQYYANMRTIDNFVYLSDGKLRMCEPYSWEEFVVVDYVIKNNTNKTVNYGISEFKISKSDQQYTGKTYDTYSAVHDGYVSSISVQSNQTVYFTLVYSVNDGEGAYYKYLFHPKEIEYVKMDVKKSSDGDELRPTMTYNYSVGFTDEILQLFTVAEPDPGYTFAVVKVTLNNGSNDGVNPITSFVLKSSRAEYTYDYTKTNYYNKNGDPYAKTLSTINIAPGYTYDYYIVYNVVKTDTDFELIPPEGTLYKYTYNQTLTS